MSDAGEQHEQGPDREGGSGLVSARSIVPTPWWHRDPARLERELRELDEAGFRYTRDTEAERRGVMRLDVYVRLPGKCAGELHLRAVFPDNYPYFQMQVIAPGLDLPHHQHPFAKTLCIFPRSTSYWRPASDTLASALRDRLQRVMQAGETTDPTVAAPLEEHTPEPFSDYYDYEPRTLVLVAVADAARPRVPASATAGTIVLGLEGVPRDGPIPPVLRGALLEARDQRGQLVFEAPASLARRYARRIEGRWARIDQPVRGHGTGSLAEAVYAASEASDPHAQKSPSHPAGDRTLRVRAVLFDEEQRWRGEASPVGDGWVFAVKLQALRAGANQPRRGMPKGRQARKLQGAPMSAAASVAYYLARRAHYGLDDLNARAPELAPLQRSTIAVFGLGCLGAPSALEFARASVGRLRLLDHDTVEAATTVRWPFGVQLAGHHKAPLLADVLASNYPYVDTTFHVHQIGAIRSVDAGDSFVPQHEDAVLNAMLDGASLLYDASAEEGVQYFLSEVARARGLPYVSVQATRGGWGGVVIRLDPARTGCWVCLQLWRAENAFALPSEESNGIAHPQGCADATYTGANFDLGEVALQGVRTAVSTLTSTASGGYPSMSWDVAVLSLRTPDGSLAAPTWTTHSLPRHPNCAMCRARE